MSRKSAIAFSLAEVASGTLWFAGWFVSEDTMESVGKFASISVLAVFCAYAAFRYFGLTIRKTLLPDVDVIREARVPVVLALANPPRAPLAPTTREPPPVISRSEAVGQEGGEPMGVPPQSSAPKLSTKRTAGREEPAGNARDRKRFINLRAKGRTYADIATALDLPKPTLLAWGRELRTEVRTATSIKKNKEYNAIAATEYAKMKRAGMTEKRWMSGFDDSRLCEICKANEAAGWIPFNEPFPSGHMRPLAHEDCGCSLDSRGGDVMAMCEELGHEETIAMRSYLRKHPDMRSRNL